MARTEKCWVYRVAVADLGGSADEAIDKLVVAVEAAMPPVHYGAGFARRDKPHVTYLIQRANKTKARRLATRLDAILGTHGELTRLND